MKIDIFTPCLQLSKTGEIVQTTYSLISDAELEALPAAERWFFHWQGEDLSTTERYKLTLENDTRVQGLLAIERLEKDRAVYVRLAESAPHNRGQNQEYAGVGGHLFAIAAQKSIDYGYGGFLFLDAKNMELVGHYQKMLGAMHLGGVHPYRMIVDEEAAQYILRIYTMKGE